MFDFIESSIKNVLDIADDILDGELPTKNAIAKLASDGLSIYAISEITGYAVETIEKILEDE